MRFDLSLAEFFGQLMREPFGQPPRVDEDQRRAVLVDQLDEPFVNFGPLLVHADGAQLGSRQLDRQVESARVADVENAARRSRLSHGRVRVSRSHQEAGRTLDRLLRRRQTNPLQGASNERFQPFNRERKVRAPLVADHRVDFVDNHGVDVFKRFAAAGGRQHQIERFGSRNQNLRRPAD